MKSLIIILYSDLQRLPPDDFQTQFKLLKMWRDLEGLFMQQKHLGFYKGEKNNLL